MHTRPTWTYAGYHKIPKTLAVMQNLTPRSVAIPLLDRAVANTNWRSRFPLMQVKNGDMYHSDHRPILIITEKVQTERSWNEGGNRFKFEASWIQEEDCRKVVEEAWESSSVLQSLALSDSLMGIASCLNDWSVNVLGYLEKRMKAVRKDLEACRRLPISDFSVRREAVLSFKLDRMEEQVELYWKQRAHVNWLQKGDRNTTFFHHCCNERRQINRIGKLLKDDVSWVEEDRQIKLFITNHFSQLFRSNGPGNRNDVQQLLDAVP